MDKVVEVQQAVKNNAGEVQVGGVVIVVVMETMRMIEMEDDG